MRNSPYFQSRSSIGSKLVSIGDAAPKKLLVAVVLFIALIAFEIFNFDTSQYALRSLLGDVQFLGIMWASILAIAFCSIDFAGLIRLFTPERGQDEPKEVWYLTGAWLLGATMNAILTWWAVSLALLSRNMGNEILSREQLLLYVPIFVAVLVWLTRILFIGAFSVAGEHLFEIHSIGNRSARNKSSAKTTNARPAAPRKTPAAPRTTRPQRTRVARPAPKPRPSATQPAYDYEELQYEPIMAKPAQPSTTPPQPQTQPASRVRQRPPRPSIMRQPAMKGVQPRNRHN